MVGVSDSTVMMLDLMLEESRLRLILHLLKNARKADGNQLGGKEGKDVSYVFDLIQVLNGQAVN